MDKMNFLLIKASTSKSGVGNDLIEKVNKIIEGKGNFRNEITIFDLSYESLSGYHSNLNDFFVENSSRISKFEKLLMKSDGIVLVCPVYLGHIPGKFKVVLDSFSYRAHEFPLLGKKVIIFTYCMSNGAKELAIYFSKVFSNLGVEVISVQSYYISDDDFDKKIQMLQKNLLQMLSDFKKNIYRVRSNQEELFRYYRSVVEEEIKLGVTSSKHTRWSTLLEYNSLTEYIEKKLLN